MKKFTCSLYIFFLLAGVVWPADVTLYQVDMPYEATDGDNITFAESTDVDGVLHIASSSSLIRTVEEYTACDIQGVWCPTGSYTINLDTFQFIWDTERESVCGDEMVLFGWALGANVRYLGDTTNHAVIKRDEDSIGGCAFAFGGNTIGSSGGILIQGIDWFNDAGNSGFINCKQNHNQAANPCSVRHVEMTNYSSWIQDRQEFNNSGINIANHADRIVSYGDDTILIAEYVYSWDNPHCAIHVDGGRFKIRACSSWIDQRNDSATTGNSYSFVMRQCTGGTCRESYAGAGLKFQGGRGIFVENNDGYDTSKTYVVGNTVQVWSGDDGENPEGLAFGLRIRAREDARVNHDDYVVACSNSVEIICDTLASTTHIGRDGTAVKVGHGDFVKDSSAGHIEIFHNRGIARSMHNNSDALRIIAFEIGRSNDQGSYGWTPPDTVWENYWASGQYIASFGDYENGYSDSDQVFYGDTLSFLPVSDSGENLDNRATVFYNNLFFEGKDNGFQDCFFPNSTPDSTSNYINNNFNHEFYAWYTLTATNSGFSFAAVVPRFWGDTVADTNYNDYTIKARNVAADDSTSESHSLAWDAKTKTLTGMTVAAGDSCWFMASTGDTLAQGIFAEAEEDIPSGATITGATITGATIR